MADTARKHFLVQYIAQIVAGAGGADVASVRFRPDKMVELVLIPNPDVPYWGAVLEQMQAEADALAAASEENDRAQPEITAHERAEA